MLARAIRHVPTAAAPTRISPAIPTLNAEQTVISAVLSARMEMFTNTTEHIPATIQALPILHVLSQTQLNYKQTALQIKHVLMDNV